MKEIEKRKIRNITKENIINLILETIQKNKQILIFNSSKRGAVTTAKNIAKEIKEPQIQNKEELEKLSLKILKTLSSPTSQCIELSNVIKKGIAFHHSGLAPKQRTLIENSFKKGIIKVISSTPTLAAGLNLPAYKVIIKDYKRYSQNGMRDIPILEYHQMSGRAGRPGKESEGIAVICPINESESERIVEKYIHGKPEQIYSKLAIEPTLKMYILSLISMDLINTKDEIKEFFANTLYAVQFQDLDELYFNIFRIIEILKTYKFIDQDDNYFYATAIGKKISQLYLNPDTAHYILEHIEKFFESFKKTNLSRRDFYSLVHFLTKTIEFRPLFNLKKAEKEKYIERLEDLDYLEVQFDPFNEDLDEFLKELKTTDVLLDWIYEASEKYIEEKYGVSPGELSYKVETIDWLLYSIEEISIMKKNYYFKNQINKLRIRFKYGIKEELIPFIKIKGIGRVRARKLYDNGFKTLADLRISEFDKIAKIIGEKLAINIKKEISNEYFEIEKINKEKPKEIKVRELPDEEIENIITTVTEYEKEKQKQLTDYFK
jgi:helicase